MLPTFLLFHAECVNEYKNAVCHLVLIPVKDGIAQSHLEFFFNPEAPFEWVMSGICATQVESFQSFKSKWPEVQAIFDEFPISVCSADGYSAHALYGTLSRLGIDFSPISYVNAKAICRRTLNEASYNFDYLNFIFYKDFIPSDEPVKIAQRWSDLVLKGCCKLPDQSLQEALANAKITPGLISPNDFEPSLCKRDYSNRVRTKFDSSSVPVDADPENPFFEANVVFTGKMESMTRNDARAAVIRVGGFAPEQLNQETDYLVVGVQDLRVVGEKGLSSKMKKAAKYKEKGLPIEIIDEEDFIEMIGCKD